MSIIIIMTYMVSGPFVTTVLDNGSLPSHHQIIDRNNAGPLCGADIMTACAKLHSHMSLTMRPEQNECYFSDDMFKCVLL